jgi:hypothetical protein
MAREASPDSGHPDAPVPSIGPQSPQVSATPEDPCLPPLYRNWQELSREKTESQEIRRFARVRIVIDRSNFQLTVEGIGSDGSAEQVYRTHVALGGPDSPTPEGSFIVNHVYCYPDVAYFGPDKDQIVNLYKGFFAPLLLCDDARHCNRFRDLGMHGYDASAYPGFHQTSQRSYGPLSGGCIRIPDPCAVKTLLISLVGVGPVKKNDRGSYHWLKTPVEVVIGGEYPWMEGEVTLLSILHQGLRQVKEGIRGMLEIFGP